MWWMLTWRVSSTASRIKPLSVGWKNGSVTARCKASRSVSQSGHYRRAEALDAGGRDTARGGDQPASGEIYLLLGPTDETEGISDGALR